MSFSGHTFVAVRDGDFLFTYCLWFEDTSGNPVSLQCPLPVLHGSPPPGIVSSSFYKYVVQQYSVGFVLVLFVKFDTAFSGI